MPTISGISSKGKPEYFNDFLLFAKDVLVFNNIMTFDFSEVHKDVASAMTSNRYVLIVLPRGHLKSTIINCYVLWRLYRHQNYEICMVSATLEQSMKNLALIQGMIETTPWLKELIPVDKDTWNKSQLRTSNGGTAYIRPFNASARGIHPNEVVMDDILRESDVSMQDIKDTFWNIFFPMGQTKGCKHIILGTPISSDDLFSEIEDKAKKGSNWTILKRKAVIEDEKGERKPLWSARYSLAELDQIKSDMGNYAFNREFLIDPAAEGSGFFPREMIVNSLAEELSFSYNTSGVVTIGADFAMSESASGDYNCFTVVDALTGMYKRKMNFMGKEVELYVVNPVIVKYIEHYKGATGQVKKIKELYDIYHASKVILDESNFGMRFAQELRELGVAVDAQDFRPTNRTMLYTNLRRLFEADDPTKTPPRIILPFSDKDNTRSKISILTKELSGFQETKTQGGYSTVASKLSHDDFVASLALAVKDVGIMRSITGQIIYSLESPNTKWKKEESEKVQSEEYQSEYFNVGKGHEWYPGEPKSF